MNHPALQTMHDDLARAEAGGKGTGLGRLLRLGLEVPPFVVRSGLTVELKLADAFYDVYADVIALGYLVRN